MFIRSYSSSITDIDWSTATVAIDIAATFSFTISYISSIYSCTNHAHINATYTPFVPVNGRDFSTRTAIVNSIYEIVVHLRSTNVNTILSSSSAFIRHSITTVIFA
jgi:hypothetical protein